MKPFSHTAELSFPAAEADYLAGALGPEIERELPKCHVGWKPGKGCGVLVIQAEDLGALRAALNSYIRWTHLALRVREKVGTS